MSEDELGPEAVSRALAPFGLQIRNMPADTSTAVAAAAALRTEVGAIVKSLLFIGEGGPVLALASGDQRVDTALLGEVIGTGSIRLAKPREVVSITGYRVGGVPPVAHRTPLPVFVDRTLTRYSRVYAAAGSAVDIFETTPEELIQISGATVADFTG